MKKLGFTLIEILVTVLVVGILAAISVGYYVGSLEDEKLDAAQAQVQAIASAEKMYAITNGGLYATDAHSNPMDNNSCLISSAANPSCPSNVGGFLAAQNWSGSSYCFCGQSASALACAQRKAGAMGSYSGWQTCVNQTGTLCGHGMSCACSCSCTSNCP